MSAPAASVDELRDLYRELILDHARSPRHFGRPGNYTHCAEGINPLCGDKLRLYLLLDDEEIRDIGFEGAGCAISMASASLLADTVGGMSKAAALDYSAAFNARLAGDATAQATQSAIDFGKLRALEGVREFPSRVKCATLAWHALRAALNTDPHAITTE